MYPAESKFSLDRLCLEIVEGYVALDEEHQQRNIVAWRPTVVEILDGFVSFSDADVRHFFLKQTDPGLVFEANRAYVSDMC